jgi:LacI family transcriptional regulator
MTTIQDVARAANVSASTVSRVLNHDASVHPALRGVVEQAICDLAYWDETHVFGAGERNRPPVAWSEALQQRGRDTLSSDVRVLRRLAV